MDGPRGRGDERGICSRFSLHVMPMNYMFTFFLTWALPNPEGRHHPFLLNAQDVQESAIPNKSPDKGQGRKEVRR
jgi:hypothetical protein